MRLITRVRSDEGAETIEFALAFPVISMLVIGLLYGFFAVAAHISLAHATSRATRFATIAIDPVSSTYPTDEAVATELDAHTPFFSDEACDVTVSPSTVENAVVTLEVGCDFPNPLALITSSSSLRMTAHGVARRE
ncbi:MAG: TadE/TadG family type IV pilus assembly protein [Actinomycetota bacterium]